ncbi:Hypothetical protein SMAX5B_000956 [Scophthalmus maximus]|uniref:Uncharacterized protein n=1 Tax=Scophthalmus maximus TaxID=52904 RepID=A0A2U9C734_SCOMX|nr:Hypothetical protein SMAX5B_000956 [Scophthalmus maximus]
MHHHTTVQPDIRVHTYNSMKQTDMRVLLLLLLRLVPTACQWKPMEGKIFGLEAWKTEQQNPTNLRPGPSQDGRKREQPRGKYQAV